ncbi:protocadherin beta-12-like [Diabrotica virgifera virgifera]|uniref:Cadherin domain-containing protein n=1 Tax=Diabrotica virgifera virgifera TaxID=50390 RepID=A0ABM5ICC5_DIAVI|nr:protocadherin beta-12-like [Diabrotica virgifera virgifera]
MAKPDFEWNNRYILWILAILFHKSITALTDNRCFLENGASSENFFVAEDLPVGSIIGQIHVHGDPRVGGSIALRLKEKDSPVIITPGTKNLTLRKQLDKEGVKGPSSVFVNLICERVGTLDPGFVIPINVRVTDVNDNAPIFINAPYILNISEVTVVGTRVLQGVHAIDNDQQGLFSSVKYSVLPGQNSDFFEFENELEGTLVLKKPLDYESLKSFDVHIRAQDHGEPPKKTDTVLTVNVVDADDQNPKFQDDRYTAILPEPPKKGSILIIKPREIRAYDQDLGINSPVYYTFNEVGVEYTFFKLNRLAGKISLAKDLADNDIPYPVTLVIRATQQDNPDRYALATITVSRHIAKGIKFLHSTFYIKASESLPIGAVLGTVSNNRPGESLRYFVSDQNILKTFSLNTKGEITLKKKLDYEDKSEYYFKVFATDGITNDSSVVNISVDNVNEWEPRFRYPHYEFFISGSPEELLGKIEAADGDKNDKLTLSLSGANSSMFTISQNGELRLKDIKDVNVGMLSLAVVATDNGRPPKSSTVPVTVHFPDSADSSGISAGKKNNSASLLLAGLGAILLVLLFVVVLLVAYICKVKRNPRSDTSSLHSDKDKNGLKKITNPMFGDRSRTPTASAMGGIPSELRSKIPSPKVHPAPQPPLWANDCSRIKKLSWGDDKTETENNENIADVSPTPTTLHSNTNLTVYF